MPALFIADLQNRLLQLYYTNTLNQFRHRGGLAKKVLVFLRRISSSHKYKLKFAKNEHLLNLRIIYTYIICITFLILKIYILLTKVSEVNFSV